MVHPTTYINKLLIANERNLVLVNPVSEKILYRFKNVMETVILGEKAALLDWVKETPLTDVVAIGLRKTN